MVIAPVPFTSQRHILILILIDVQNLNNVAFNLEKVSNGQSYSSSNFDTQ